MTTLSTDGLFTQLRTHVLSYIPLTGTTLMQRLGTGTLASSRLWKDAPPDTAAYPYGVMRLLNQLTSGEYNGERERIDFEIMLFARPRAQAVALEDMADLIDQAMLRYRDASSGLSFSRSRQRDTLPPPTSPADREVVQIRLVYPLVVWPRYLTQWSDPTPDPPALDYMLITLDGDGDIAITDDPNALPLGTVTIDPITGDPVVDL
jgi:hypothetical protein